MYNIGDKVRIANNFSPNNSKMNKWRGKVMTIKNIMCDNDWYTMNEDEGECPSNITISKDTGWMWEKSWFTKVGTKLC